jgi:hypothetical protein
MQTTKELAMRKSLLAVTAITVMFGAGFLTTEAIAKAKAKSIWCMVDKKSGDFSSSCYKTKEQCMKEALKKGMTCGMTFE